MKKKFLTIFLFSFLLNNVMAQISSVDKLRVNKCYLIQSKDNNRGAFYSDPVGYLSHCGASESYVNSYSYLNSDIAVSATDTRQQFAFIKINDRYYLYSVSEKKFAKNANDGYVKLVDTLDPNDYVTIENAESAGGVQYFHILINGTNKLNISGGSGRTYGIWANYNTADDGNNLKITEAADFDPSEAYEKLSHSLPCFLQNWATNTNWEDDVTSKPDGLPNAPQNSEDGDIKSVKMAETYIAVPENVDITVSFVYTNGNHALNILGVEVVGADGNVVQKHYEAKHAGSDYVYEVYTLSGIEPGNYKLRYYIARLADNKGNLGSTNGKIIVYGANNILPEEECYYRLKCLGNYLSGVVSNDRLEIVTENALNNPDLVFIYKDGAFISYSKGLSINAYKLDEVGTKSTPTIDIKHIIGKYRIKYGDRYIYGKGDTQNNHLDSGTGDPNGSGYYWTFEPVTSLPVNITAARYATFYAPVAVQVPTGVKAYYITSENVKDSYISMTAIEENAAIPAGEGVVLELQENYEAGVYNFDIVADVDALTGNLLEGTVAMELIEKDPYVLAMLNNAVGLYKTTLENNKFKNNGHKAYLPAENLDPAVLNSVGYRFDGEALDGTTSIDDVVVAPANEVIYDLQGRRVNDMTERGIYVIGNKKVLVK